MLLLEVFYSIILRVILCITHFNYFAFCIPLTRRSMSVPSLNSSCGSFEDVDLFSTITKSFT